MSMWAQFAPTADPFVDGPVDWPTYTEESPRYLDVGLEMEVLEDIEEAHVAPPQD